MKNLKLLLLCLVTTGIHCMELTQEKIETLSATQSAAHKKEMSHQELMSRFNEQEQLLNLRYCSQLPSHLSMFTKLRTLIIHFYKLENFPQDLTSLRSLEDLELESSRFTEMPLFIQHLTNLRRLNLSFNQIEAVPSWVGTLIRLTCLEIAYNQLKELSPDINGCSSLVRLDLMGNQLTGLPSLSQLSHLTHICLSNNKLPKIPDALYNCVFLISVDLSENHGIKKIDTEGLYPHLKCGGWIRLSANQAPYETDNNNDETWSTPSTTSIQPAQKKEFIVKRLIKQLIASRRNRSSTNSSKSPMSYKILNDANPI